MKGDQCQNGDAGRTRASYAVQSTEIEGEKRQTSGSQMMFLSMHYFRCIDRTRHNDLSGKK